VKFIAYTVEFAYDDFGYNDPFSSVLAKFLIFNVQSSLVNNDFSYIITSPRPQSDASCRSPHNILIAYNDSCKFSLQFEV